MDEEDGATPFGRWPVRMTRPHGALTARGGCPRWAAMVLMTTGADGDGERRVTAAAVGGGGGGPAKSTSMGADEDDPASHTSAGGDGDAVGRPHSTTGSGTTVVHPWRTQKCTFCTCTRRSGISCIGGSAVACPAANASNIASSTMCRTLRIRCMRMEMVCSIPCC